MTQFYGQLDPLYEAVQLHFPQVDAARVHLQDRDGLPPWFMRVSYRSDIPRRIVWDDGLGTYRWDSGPDAGAQLARDANRAAEQIAWALGATPQAGGQ
ncbi:hypothetical protein OHR68_10035 [Spirillospora sp. NBC_00431]